MSLNTKQKIQAISECPEIMLAVKMLICVMEDADLKHHVTLDYELNNQNYELIMSRLQIENYTTKSNRFTFLFCFFFEVVNLHNE